MQGSLRVALRDDCVFSSVSDGPVNRGDAALMCSRQRCDGYSFFSGA